jgi:hypothetical protein
MVEVRNALERVTLKAWIKETSWAASGWEASVKWVLNLLKKSLLRGNDCLSLLYVLQSIPSKLKLVFNLRISMCFKYRFNFPTEDSLSDFRLPPPCRWDLRSSGILRSVEWKLRTGTYRSHLQIKILEFWPLKMGERLFRSVVSQQIADLKILWLQSDMHMKQTDLNQWLVG